jgi:hypothetical protein
MIKKHRSKIDERKKQAIMGGPLWHIVRKYANGEMRLVLNEIKDRKKDDPLRTLLMNYLTVRTVTVFEVFMLNLAERYIQEHLDVADKLLVKPVMDKTIGDQLISNYSFMNTDNVNSVFSEFIGTNFFRAIRKRSVEYATDYCYESEHIKWASPLHKNWTKFERIFQLRHGIVHHNKLVRFPWKYYRDMIESVLDFMMCAVLLVRLNYERKQGQAQSG